ncbi:MAG: glycosyl transferase family 2, partial [Rhodothermales bacterium]|nr:glycosyl transferase family 2 [Rhodothermales bacterium]
MALLLLFPALYALLIGGVAWLTTRAPRHAPAPAEPLPRIAVLVAARNEEDRLPRCLDALLAQDYPTDRLDI